MKFRQEIAEVAQGLKEVVAMQQGRKPKKTLEEFIGQKIEKELTAAEEKEAFLYTSKVFASKAFGDKI